MNKADRKVMQALIDRLVPIVGEFEELIHQVETEAGTRLLDRRKGLSREFVRVHRWMEIARDTADEAINVGSEALGDHLR